MIKHWFPFGTTEYQEFTLEADGAVIDLTGQTLGIEITDADDTAVTGAGTASIVTAATGRVRFAPTGTLPRGRYSVRWTVTSIANGRLFKVPTEQPDEWRVGQP